MPASVSRGFDIGGPDVLTYREMMQRYAARRRALAPRGSSAVPVLTPSAVQPLGRPGDARARQHRPAAGRLAASTRWCARSTTSRSTCRTRPSGLVGFDRAVELALARIQDARRRHHVVVRRPPPARRATRCPATRTGRAAPCYVDDRSSAGGRHARGPVVGDRGHRRRATAGTPGALGWVARGLHGPALRRAGAAARSPAPARPAPSATRSTGGGSRRSRTGRLLRLRAEMRLPGLAWLELSSRSDDRAADRVPAARRLPPARAARARSTGGRSARSTASCSAACSATSPRPPRRPSAGAVPPGGGPPAGPPPDPGPRPQQSPFCSLVEVAAVRAGCCTPTGSNACCVAAKIRPGHVPPPRRGRRGRTPGAAPHASAAHPRA